MNLKDQFQTTALLEGQLALWSLGNLGFVFKSAGGTLFAVDPYLTRSIETALPGTEFKRVVPPPLEPEDLRDLGAVFVTHEHDDHLDPETLGRLHAAAPHLPIVVPGGLAGAVRAFAPGASLVEAQEGVPFLLQGVSVTPLAAVHPVAEKDAQGKSLRLGYHFDFGAIKVFHSGDTLVHAGLVTSLKELKPHVLIVPINGGDYFRRERGIVANMNAREAADLASAVGADLVIPAHFDLFPSNRERPSLFVDYVHEAHPQLKFHYFKAGERFIYAL